jgi:peptidoglycan lytic transglycosylase G
MKKIIIIFLALIVLVVIGFLIFITEQANKVYGPATSSLGTAGKLKYSTLLLWHDGLLTQPRDPTSSEQSFKIGSGESVDEIASRLESSGLISSATAFRDYLVYSGLDTTIQTGDFTLSAAMPPLAIAAKLQDGTPTQVLFAILPGWRMEEVAASLPTSGLNISPEEFLAAARKPHIELDYLPADATAEGFLFPMQYTLPRGIRADELVKTLLQNFDLYLSPEIQQGIKAQGLTVYQAVILASIIQRESVVDDEMPMIASVFLNRLGAGMKLETDPSVQYAVGWDSNKSTWWKNPLAASDLQVESPYNTYLYPGLPPAPISNPSLAALRAVAFPAKSSYYYFRARCDGSGLHAFAETYDEHINNACP